MGNEVENAAARSPTPVPVSDFIAGKTFICEPVHLESARCRRHAGGHYYGLNLIKFTQLG